MNESISRPLLRLGRTWFAAVWALGFAMAAGAAPAEPNQRIVLKDGVELWQVLETTPEKPSFFRRFEQIVGVPWPHYASVPFGRSVAFLLGVSEYESLSPDLPFARNDVMELRRYLLEEGGFDQVYVALDGVVTADLIENYMMNKFPAELGEKDRLLFYYAGHGADARGATGYFQLAKAREGDFARHVLSVTRLLEWSRVNPAGHILFLLDSCSSGLAFTPRSGALDGERKLLRTVSGGGSRAVITAGTADEQTFEIPDGKGQGNGIFTRSLLAALRQGRTGEGAAAVLTLEQIAAELQLSVAQFSARYGKPLHPRLWTFDDALYTGSFVFLNPGARPGMEQLTRLGLRSPKESEPGAGQASGPTAAPDASLAARSHESDSAVLEISWEASLWTGLASYKILVDDREVGELRRNETIRLVVAPGSREVRLRNHSAGSYSTKVGQGPPAIVPPTDVMTEPIKVSVPAGGVARLDCKSSMKAKISCGVVSIVRTPG
jgi:uncharacterized caspase-like protein